MSDSLRVFAGEFGSVVTTVEVIHEHSEEGGVCYEPVYHSHDSSCYSNVTCGGSISGRTVNQTCGSTSWSLGNYGPLYTYVNGVWTETGRSGYRIVTCGRGHTTTNSINGVTTPSGACGAVTGSTTYYSCASCGHSYGTSNPGSCNQQVSRLTCTKDGTTIDSYSLVCGLDSVSYGTLQISKYSSGADYTLTLVNNLSLTYVSSSSVSYSSDGISYTSGSVINVTSNGTYYFKVVYTDSVGEHEKVLSYTVTDYDGEPPVVSGVNQPAGRCQDSVVSIQATDNVGVVWYKLESNQ